MGKSHEITMNDGDGEWGCGNFYCIKIIMTIHDKSKLFINYLVSQCLVDSLWIFPQTPPASRHLFLSATVMSGWPVLSHPQPSSAVLLLSFSLPFRPLRLRGRPFPGRPRLCGLCTRSAQVRLAAGLLQAVVLVGVGTTEATH